MRKATDLTGRKFGRLTVIVPNTKKTGYIYSSLCVCECGNKKNIRNALLINGGTKSCGCLNKELSSIRNRKHGLALDKIYTVWVNMTQRCNNPKSTHFNHYGGRGIFVCERWLFFTNFYEDMNFEYKEELEIDRINNDDGYYKENCRWATKKQSARNRRPVKLNEEKVTEIRKSNLKQKELAIIYGVAASAINKVKNFKSWV